MLNIRIRDRISAWFTRFKKCCHNVLTTTCFKGFRLYDLFLILLLASWGMEVFTGKSLMEKFYPNRICPIFLQAPTILEAIKVVGFSNILIGWVYKSLDAQMLGLSYRELILHQYPSYHACSIAHICATIFCILSAAAGTSESAVIALLAVLYGFFYQGIVLYRIVLNANECEKAALSRWKVKIQESDTMMPFLLRLAGTIPTPESEHYQAHLACFAQAFTKYSTWIYQQMITLKACCRSLPKTQTPNGTVTNYSPSEYMSALRQRTK